MGCSHSRTSNPRIITGGKTDGDNRIVRVFRTNEVQRANHSDRLFTVREEKSKLEESIASPLLMKQESDNHLYHPVIAT